MCGHLDTPTERPDPKLVVYEHHATVLVVFDPTIVAWNAMRCRRHAAPVGHV